MEDAERMGFGERVAHLEQKVDSLIDGESADPSQQDVKRSALQELQHYVRGARIRDPRVEHAHDVLALELGYSLPPRPPDARFVAVRHVGKKDRHRLIEQQVSGATENDYAAPHRDLLHEVPTTERFAHSPIASRSRKAVKKEPAKSGCSGFVAHYHSERNHQGLGNLISFPARPNPDAAGDIRRRQRLGGLLSFYERTAV
jgi:hypothetical protein